MSITVTLEADLEARLRARVDAGEFPSLDAAVEEAVREFVLPEPPIEELRAKISIAIAQLDRGEGVPFDIEDIKRAGRERLEQRRK
jgi:Arc/MetJ-type ribon-helix-helix transcriptional regulator